MLLETRTKNLREYANQIESNLESNLLNQKDCQDQLSNFFGVGLSNLAMVQREDLIFSSPFIAPYLDGQWAEGNSSHNAGGRAQDSQRSAAFRARTEAELSAEEIRKIIFSRQNDYKVHLRMLEKKAAINFGHLTVSDKETKKGKIILSEKIIETLLFQGNTLLNSTNQAQSQENHIDNKKTLQERLAELKVLLTRLRHEKPREFIDLITTFQNDKQHYESAMKEIESKQTY